MLEISRPPPSSLLSTSPSPSPENVKCKDAKQKTKPSVVDTARLEMNVPQTKAYEQRRRPHASADLLVCVCVNVYVFVKRNVVPAPDIDVKRT